MSHLGGNSMDISQLNPHFWMLMLNLAHKGQIKEWRTPDNTWYVYFIFILDSRKTLPHYKYNIKSTYIQTNTYHIYIHPIFGHNMFSVINQINCCQSDACWYPGALLITWFNFSTSIDKKWHVELSVGWNYLCIPKLQRLRRWSFGMDK